ncbi:MAG: serine/threonine-protein kinase [Planctomycetota bacterium]
MNQRERLYCILAVQNGFITRGELAATLEQVGEDSGMLEQHLRQLNSVGEQNVRRIHQIVDCVLERYEQDIDRAVSELGGSHTLHSRSSGISQLKDHDLTRTVSTQNRISFDSQTTKTYEAPLSPFPSTVLRENNFNLIREHARGGLGVVHVAEDEQLKRNVALKQIRADRADDPYFRYKFVKEAEITGRLEHPGIVPVYSMGVDEQGRPFYAMRFIHGETLSHEISNLHEQRKKAPRSFDVPLLRQLVRRIVEVCNAMAYAHAHSIVHRDLKPSNVMLGKYGETLVVDWGLAKQAETQSHEEDSLANDAVTVSSEGMTADGRFVGTLAYAPPEQLLGETAKVSHRSDIYSIGAMLFEILTGRPTIQKASSTNEALLQIGQVLSDGCSACNEQIPPALAAICDKAMQLEPDERYGNATALADDLENWLDDRPISAYRDPLMHRAYRWARNNQKKATAGVVGGLAILLLAGGYFFLDSRRQQSDLRAEAQKNRAIVESAARQSLIDQVSVAETQGDLKGAIAALEKIARMRSGLSNTQLIDLAEKYFLDQKPVSAIKTIESIDTSILPAKQLARHDLVLGDILYGTTEESRGHELLERSLESGQLSSSDASYIRGVLASTPEGCIQELTNCLNLQPQKSMARFRLAMTLMFTGQPRKAIETAELGKLLSPQDWRFDMAIAFSYATMADTDAMEEVLRSFSDNSEAVPLANFCRVIHDMHDFVNQKFQRPQRQLQMTDVLKTSTMVAEIMTQVVPAVLASQQADGLAIPKLGWIGNLYERVGTPALEPTQLSMWLMQLFMTRNLGGMIQELADLMPNHRMVQSFQMLNMIESRSFEDNIAMLHRIDQTEQTLNGLDLNLAVWVIPTIANQEPAVEKGARRRLDQIRELQPWADRLRTVFTEHAFKPNGEEELVLAVAWGLLVKNGFFGESTSIAESQLERGIWTGAAKERWEARLALSRDFEQQHETHMKAFADRISKDPRYIIMPKPDPPATEAEASDAVDPFR